MAVANVHCGALRIVTAVEPEKALAQRPGLGALEQQKLHFGFAQYSSFASLPVGG
jgi:hypothetical protein